MSILNPSLCSRSARTSPQGTLFDYRKSLSGEAPKGGMGRGGKWKQSYGSQSPFHLPPLLVSLPHPSSTPCPKHLWPPLASEVPCHCYSSNSVLPFPASRPAPASSAPIPSLGVGKAPLPVVCSPATCCTTGVFLHWPHCWENYSLCSVRLPLLASPYPPT